MGQYLWIGQDVADDEADANLNHILIGVTSREGPKDDLYHIDLYKLIEDINKPGAYNFYEYALDTIHISPSTKFKQNLLETVTFSAGNFFWIDVYTGTRMAEQMKICGSRQFYDPSQ